MKIGRLSFGGPIYGGLARFFTLSAMLVASVGVPRQTRKTQLGYGDLPDARIAFRVTAKTTRLPLDSNTLFIEASRGESARNKSENHLPGWLS